MVAVKSTIGQTLPPYSAGFLLGLHFYSEDGGGIFLRNAPRTTKRYNPEDIVINIVSQILCLFNCQFLFV
jgi:hypothetical protein